MHDPRPRRRNDADLETDLLGRARLAGDATRRPTVETVVTIADPLEAARLRARQLAAIVRLLRQAVEAGRVH